MEVIIIVFTAIIQNDPEMKQELETSIFSTPFLFMSIFILPSLDADPFIHISEGSRPHLGRIKTPSLFPSSALALGHQALA